MHYTVIVDGADGAYGVQFPDLPGCTAMGSSVDEALSNAAEALREWVETTTAMGGDVPAARSPKAILDDEEVRLSMAEDGGFVALVPLIRKLGRPTKANLSLDSGILSAIDATAERLGVTRSAMVEQLATEHLGAYA